MATNAPLLRVAYGINASELSAYQDGTLYFDTSSKELGVKLPDNNFFFILSPKATTADKVANKLTWYYGASNSTYDGGSAGNIYLGTKLVAGTANTATSNATAVTNPYIAPAINSTSNTDWVSGGTGIQLQGGTATTVTAANGVITISSPSIPDAIKNPLKLTFSATSATYDGSQGLTVDYGDVGAAPASGIGVTAINWDGAASTFKLPASIMPKEALLDLIYVDGTNPMAATGIQAGDIILTNGNSKLYYVTAASNGVATATSEIKVGNSAWASTADKVSNPFTVSKYNGSGNTQVISFNGAEKKDIAIRSGLAVTANSTGVTYSSTAQTANSVWINYLFDITASTASTATIMNRVNLVGGTSITVASDANGKITITGKDSLKNPNNLNWYYNSSTTANTYSGAEAGNIYIGSKLFIGASTSAVANAAVTNNTVYLNVANRTEDSTWTSNGGIIIQGAGATTVSSNTSGVLTVTSLTIPATLPNPLLLIIQAAGSQAIAYNGSAGRTINIKAGTGISSVTRATTSSGADITITAKAYTASDPIHIGNYVITHNTSGATAGTYGPTGQTLTLNNTTMATIAIPRITVNNTGHITNIGANTISFKAPVTQGFTEGELVGTVLGQSLYCGITWDTF